jgi:hypothetical protein
MFGADASRRAIFKSWVPGAGGGGRRGHPVWPTSKAAIAKKLYILMPTLVVLSPVPSRFLTAVLTSTGSILHYISNVLSCVKSYLLGPIIFLYLPMGAVVEPSPLFLRPFIALLYQPWMIDSDDCGAIDGMNGWQGKPKFPVPLCPPQIPHNMTSARTRAAAMGSRRDTVQRSLNLTQNIQIVLLLQADLLAISLTMNFYFAYYWTQKMEATFPPKHRSTSNGLHTVTSITSAMSISNPIRVHFICRQSRDRPTIAEGLPPTNLIVIVIVAQTRPPLCSIGQSSWLHIRRSRVRFPAPPDFLRNIAFGTGSTQPREYK